MIPKDSVKWFDKQFLSTSHSFVHISHCVCVCVCVICLCSFCICTCGGQRSPLGGFLFCSPPYIFETGLLSESGDTNWVDCVSSRHKGNVYLCLTGTGIHNPSPQPAIYVGARNSNSDAGVYLGTLSWLSHLPAPFHLSESQIVVLMS